jgi:hypothetical protein
MKLNTGLCWRRFKRLFFAAIINCCTDISRTDSLEVRKARIDLSTAMSILRGGMDSPESLDQLSRLFVPDKYLRIRADRRHRLFAAPACSTVARAQSPLCRMHHALNALLVTHPEFDVFVDNFKCFLKNFDVVH